MPRRAVDKQSVSAPVFRLLVKSSIFCDVILSDEFDPTPPRLEELSLDYLTQSTLRMYDVGLHFLAVVLGLSQYVYAREPLVRIGRTSIVGRDVPTFAQEYFGSKF